MKFLVAIAAFLFVLGFNLNSVAEEGHGADAANPAACSKDSTGKECAEGGHDAHGASAEHPGKKPGYGANYDWSHKRQGQISAIFPTKQKTEGANTVPAKVKIVSPKFLSTVSGDTVKLEWAAAEGATTYHVQVSKDAGFNNRSMYVAEDKRLAATSFEVKGLEAGVKYFWRVAAVNEGQESTFTKSPFTFSEFEAK